MTDQTDVQASFRVHGRVQGVGFRWWTRRTASRLGVTGSVRNLPDGTVEVLARGARDAVRELESHLQQGPSSASVRRVERGEPAADDIPADDFRIER